MVQIGKGVASVAQGCALGVDGLETALPLLVLDIDGAVGSKQQAVAPVACRHHTVEHVHPALNGLQYVGWRAHPHQVTGFVFR